MICDSDMAIYNSPICPECKAKLRELVLSDGGNRDRDEAGPDKTLETTDSRVLMSREDMANLWLVGAEAPPIQEQDIEIPCKNCRNNINGEICDWGDYFLNYTQLPHCPKFKEI